MKIVDARPFLVEFFNAFGISKRKVATFEQRIKKLDFCRRSQAHGIPVGVVWKILG